MKLFPQILLTLFSIAIVIVVPQSGIVTRILPFPFSYSVVMIAFIWLILKLLKEDFADIGFKFKQFSSKALLTGIISGILLFVFLQYILSLVKNDHTSFTG